MSRYEIGKLVSSTWNGDIFRRGFTRNDIA